MIKSSIIHRATREFCYPICEGTFRIRIATAQNDVNSITLHTIDKYLDPVKKDTRESFTMKKITSDGLYDYFETENKISSKQIS